jgi:hypothetical protein
LFIAQPLFEFDQNKIEINGVVESVSEKDNKLISYINEFGLLRRVEIYDEFGDLSSVFVYSDFQQWDEIFFPGNIQVIDLHSGIELNIKLYHFSPEYFNLSNL